MILKIIYTDDSILVVDDVTSISSYQNKDEFVINITVNHDGNNIMKHDVKEFTLFGNDGSSILLYKKL